jgi:pimeloyl-ACP methyl ester carboxylesterase
MTDGLLLVHAFPVDARMWDAQVRTFSGSLPVLAPHLPGFGGAPSAGEVMTMEAAARRCLGALDEAGVEGAVVCGLSMGGYVSFAIRELAPHRVRGLVLANTRAEADPPEGAAGRRALAQRLRAEGHGFMVAEPPPLLSEQAPQELQELVRSAIADQAPEAIAAAALGMAERPDRSGELASIDIPTLVITSDGDRLIAPNLTAPMASAIPGAELRTIDGAGHLSNLEAPEAFEEGLAAHLARCGLG